MGLIEEFHQAVASHGIEKKDILRASGFFVGLNVLWIAGLWSFCFIVRPTQNIIMRLPYPRLKNAFQNGQKKAEKWKIFKRLPIEIRGVLSVSFCEMLTLKGLLGPVALPFKVWLAAKLALMSKFDEEAKDSH